MGFLLYIFYFAWGIAQIFAFVEGAHVWLGFGNLGTIICLFLCWALGAPGALAMAIVGYFGATQGWHWPVWQAAILTFPFVIFTIAFLGFAGVGGLISKLRR